MSHRKLRSDFGTCQTLGAWAEDRVLEAVNLHPDIFFRRYGLSQSGPVDGDQSYFDDILDYQGGRKRPDLLGFHRDDTKEVARCLARFGRTPEQQTSAMAALPESNPDIVALLKRARLAIEVETSAYVATAMRNYGEPLRPQSRCHGLPGLPANPGGMPTIFIKKEDDLERILAWQANVATLAGRPVPVHIWLIFANQGKVKPLVMGIGVHDVTRLIRMHQVVETNFEYQRSGTKPVYRVPEPFCYRPLSFNRVPTWGGEAPMRADGRLVPILVVRGGSAILTSHGSDVLRNPEADYRPPRDRCA